VTEGLSDITVQPLFEVDASAEELQLTAASAWIIDGIGNPLEDCDFDGPIHQLELTVLQDPPSLESEGYANLLSQLGYPKTKPAGMRLRDTVRRNGFRQHGLLVDAVNLVAARYAAGIGLHTIQTSDLDAGSNLMIWRAAGTESIIPAFSSEPKQVPAGDLLYGWERDGVRKPIAWLGKKDVDGADRQVTSATKSALLVILGYPNATVGYSADICASILELLRRYRPDVTVRLIRTVRIRPAA
jgi:DNA/RNA-binding domain of Phe-tRNA-synthetase-like protein